MTSASTYCTGIPNSISFILSNLDSYFPTAKSKYSSTLCMATKNSVIWPTNVGSYRMGMVTMDSVVMTVQTMAMVRVCVDEVVA